MLEKQKSLTDIETYLKEEGLKRWDVEKIIQSVNRHYRHKYKAKIKSYMLEGSLASKLSEFDDMDDDLFEKVQHEIIAEEKAEVRKEVKPLIKEGKSEDEIIAIITNQFLDSDEIAAIIELEVSNTSKKTKEKNKGITYISLGVILSIASFTLNMETTIVFTGLIVYGIFAIFKSQNL